MRREPLTKWPPNKSSLSCYGEVCKYLPVFIGLSGQKLFLNVCKKQKVKLDISQNFVTIQYMKHGFWIIAAVMLAGCGGSLEKHMNATMAYYIEKVHVACTADADCTAVLLSCRYPQWGYAAVNRMEVPDLNRIREADWYTRCEKTPDTSHIKTWCDNGRCRLQQANAESIR